MLLVSKSIEEVEKHDEILFCALPQVGSMDMYNFILFLSNWSLYNTDDICQMMLLLDDLTLWLCFRGIDDEAVEDDLQSCQLFGQSDGLDQVVLEVLDHGGLEGLEIPIAADFICKFFIGDGAGVDVIDRQILIEPAVVGFFSEKGTWLRMLGELFLCHELFSWWLLKLIRFAISHHVICL